jgi:hypothetical protein
MPGSKVRFLRIKVQVGCEFHNLPPQDHRKAQHDFCNALGFLLHTWHVVDYPPTLFARDDQQFVCAGRVEQE